MSRRSSRTYSPDRTIRHDHYVHGGYAAPSYYDTPTVANYGPPRVPQYSPARVPHYTPARVPTFASYNNPAVANTTYAAPVMNPSHAASMRNAIYAPAGSSVEIRRETTTVKETIYVRSPGASSTESSSSSSSSRGSSSGGGSSGSSRSSAGETPKVDASRRLTAGSSAPSVYSAHTERSSRTARSPARTERASRTARSPARTVRTSRTKRSPARTVRTSRTARSPARTERTSRTARSPTPSQFSEALQERSTKLIKKTPEESDRAIARWVNSNKSVSGESHRSSATERTSGRCHTIRTNSVSGETERGSRHDRPESVVSHRTSGTARTGASHRTSGSKYNETSRR